MKALNKIEFKGIEAKANYFVTSEELERYGVCEPKGMFGTGEELIELIKESFNYEDWREDEEDGSLADFLTSAEDRSNDIGPILTIFKI